MRRHHLKGDIFRRAFYPQSLVVIAFISSRSYGASSFVSIHFPSFLYCTPLQIAPKRVSQKRRVVDLSDHSGSYAPPSVEHREPQGGGGALNKELYGEAPPRGRNPHPFIHKKLYPFRLPSVEIISLPCTHGENFTTLFT